MSVTTVVHNGIEYNLKSHLKTLEAYGGIEEIHNKLLSANLFGEIYLLKHVIMIDDMFKTDDRYNIFVISTNPVYCDEFGGYLTAVKFEGEDDYLKLSDAYKKYSLEEFKWIFAPI